MTERRIDGFFYGLFMDDIVLINCGVEPINPRPAFVNNYALYIGNRATLAANTDSQTYGMLYSLTHRELDTLYGSAGLEDYRAEALIAHTLDGNTLPALCFNLPNIPKTSETNTEYALKLQQVLTRLGFPAEYITGIH